MTPLMKALSVRQPWAWLICRPDLNNILARRAAEARGELKDVENRSWYTNERGGVFVHASTKIDFEAYAWVKERFPDITIPPHHELEVGGIVGRTIIRGCVQPCDSPWYIPGQWAFRLEASEPLPLHPCRGQLGFFEVPGFTRPK